jgi:hypothetical protein
MKSKLLEIALRTSCRVVANKHTVLTSMRCVLSDKLLPERTRLSDRLVEGRDLHVYSVPDANLAGYAVTKVCVPPAGGRLSPCWRTRCSIRARLPSSPCLTSCWLSYLTVERGGYRIEADSPGTSLLVLPIEYSHCLRADLTTTGANLSRLLRANLTMAAILFSGRVEGTLMLRYGPLSSRCRIEDWQDANALRLGEAREWPMGLVRSVIGDVAQCSDDRTYQAVMH